MTTVGASRRPSTKKRPSMKAEAPSSHGSSMLPPGALVLKATTERADSFSNNQHPKKEGSGQNMVAVPGLHSDVELGKLFEMVQQNNEMLIALMKDKGAPTFPPKQNGGNTERVVSRDFGSGILSAKIVPAPAQFQI